MSDSYDVIVIGGGTGGYPAAIRAGQLGFKTACINSWINRDGKPAYGGTCLNAGCIPSKALLESSELYHRAEHEMATHGISVGKPKLDVAAMQKRKTDICSSLTGGIGQLFKANGVTGLEGFGKLLGDGKVEFKPHKGETKTLSAKHIIVATGSEPVELKKIAAFDHDKICDSWDALDFDKVPKRLGIIGAGVIGVELGSVWARLGSEVTILEALPTFLPMVDQAIAKDALRQFKKQGLDIRLGAKVLGAKANAKSVTVEFESGKDKQTENFDKLIVAVGRRPFTEGLNAEGVGLELDERGFIKVDRNYRTNLPNVYATGDVIGGPMLAHKGIEEGVCLVEQLHGEKPEVNYDVIPSVIYTAPEVAWVGLSEEQAKEKGFEVKTGTSPFAANGRSKAMEAASGTVKVISDAKSDRILGVHMVGPYVSEVLQSVVVAMEFGATTADLQLTMHGHPTLAEALHEAYLAVDGHAIHAVNKKK